MIKHQLNISVINIYGNFKGPSRLKEKKQKYTVCIINCKTPLKVSFPFFPPPLSVLFFHPLSLFCYIDLFFTPKRRIGMSLTRLTFLCFAYRRNRAEPRAGAHAPETYGGS